MCHPRKLVHCRAAIYRFVIGCELPDGLQLGGHALGEGGEFEKIFQDDIDTSIELEAQDAHAQ